MVKFKCNMSIYFNHFYLGVKRNVGHGNEEEARRGSPQSSCEKVPLCGGLLGGREGTLRIIAVMHLRRKPGYWHGRLDE